MDENLPNADFNVM
uniref:Uncharacterized protein n=1 Tax=Meloidogyne javanica TaxID=6303 RepID=A0A915MN44_MELJA